MARRMQVVDIRWRPSGGRGEYEHVPSGLLLERNVVVNALVLNGALIRTDVWGRIRDGKPRLRRENRNDRAILNLPNLIAALALLPDPKREDGGAAIFPLADKNYVISSISFEVQDGENGEAICTPLRMKILHDSGEIDLFARLQRVGDLLSSDFLPEAMRNDATDFLSLVEKGLASVELRRVADRLMGWVVGDSKAAAFLDAPSEIVLDVAASGESSNLKIDEMGADETRRRLRTHFKIDRSRKIRKAKVANFLGLHGAVYCENCSFDFSRKYGARGAGFIEVHHVVPLAALLPSTVTYLSDLLLLCANCHRMVHRKRPDLTPHELKSITQ